MEKLFGRNCLGYNFKKFSTLILRNGYQKNAKTLVLKNPNYNLGEIKMENEIENLKETIKNLKGLIEEKEKYNDDVCKHLSAALSDVRKLKNEKSILLSELSTEIKKRIELESKLFFFEEDSQDLPF